MNISIEEKKAEAVRRMKMLKIFPETIKQFEKDGYISRSEPPVGAYYWVEGKELEAIREFEKEHDCLVYTVVRAYTSIGMMDSYLFVNTPFGVRPVEAQRPPQSWCYVEENGGHI